MSINCVQNEKSVYTHFSKEATTQINKKKKPESFRVQRDISKQFSQCATVEPIRKMFYISVGLSFFFGVCLCRAPAETNGKIMFESQSSTHITRYGNGNSKFMCVIYIEYIALCRL